MILRKQKIFIFIGSLLWITGFFMAAATVYPFALIGVYLGPPILILGIIGWIINHKRTNGHFPNPIRSFNRILRKQKGLSKYHLAIFEFMFSYLLHFWIFCIMFWIGLTFLGKTVLKNSNVFTKTKEYVEKDKELIMRIGKIKYYGFLIGGSFSTSGDADISFSIIGNKETIDVKALIKNGRVIVVKYR